MTKRIQYIYVAAVLAICALLLAVIAGRGVWLRARALQAPVSSQSSMSASPTNSLEEYNERYQRVMSSVRASQPGSAEFMSTVESARQQLLLLMVPPDRRDQHLQTILLLDEIRTALSSDSQADTSASWQQLLEL